MHLVAAEDNAFGNSVALTRNVWMQFARAPSVSAVSIHPIMYDITWGIKQFIQFTPDVVTSKILELSLMYA